MSCASTLVEVFLYSKRLSGHHMSAAIFLQTLLYLWIYQIDKETSPCVRLSAAGQYATSTSTLNRLLRITPFNQGLLKCKEIYIDVYGLQVRPIKLHHMFVALCLSSFPEKKTSICLMRSCCWSVVSITTRIILLPATNHSNLQGTTMKSNRRRSKISIHEWFFYHQFRTINDSNTCLRSLWSWNLLWSKGMRSCTLKSSNF